jgi:hypothetical protein
MLKANRTYLLLLLIFIFSFGYRMLLLFWNNFPSGADIGLHNSVIYSVTGSGSTNFMYNAYQMGGGISLTFPGYHIFASSIILMTGLSEYVAQAIIVALFSSLIVLCAFLVTKSIWSTSAAFIVAFLVAISRFDIEMLLWGGYPNVVTLMLIPLTFYLFLQKDRFTLTSFLVSTSILVGTIFLTHSLSTAIFVGITFLTVLCILIAPQKLGTQRKTCLYWLLPVVIGAILVLPFLMQAIPTYLSDNSSAPGVPGAQDINSAILSTRILPLEFVLPLFAIIVAYILFSKTYKRRFISLSVLLLSLWLFVPLFLTQVYLFGFIIDYNRFLYFIILPVLIFIAVLIDHGSGFFAGMVNFYRSLPVNVKKTKQITDKKIKWLQAHLTNKTVYGVFILFFLVLSFVFIPIFMTPSQNVGETIQSFYQVMNNPGWEAIQWAKQNTPTKSVFVSDALYGWWFSGFAQRPTLSAVDPQYLTSTRELDPAMNATNLLDTDYLLDNGLVQVRDDGGYLARHNPEILATLNWTYFPYSFFTFDSSDIQVFYTIDGNLMSVMLDQLAVKQMQMQKVTDENNTTLQAAVIIVRGNDYLNYTQITTVYKGLPFVKITATIDAANPNVSLRLVLMSVESKGYQVSYPDNRTVCMIDEGVKAFGQLIFNVNQPAVSVKTVSPRLIDLQYNLEGKSQAKLEISASAYSVTDDLQFYTNPTVVSNYFASIITDNLKANQTPSDILFKQTFDYQAEIQNHSVSYIACRVPEMYPKFLKDPAFSLVFINAEVAIFKVNGHFNQNG